MSPDDQVVVVLVSTGATVMMGTRAFAQDFIKDDKEGVFAIQERGIMEIIEARAALMMGAKLGVSITEEIDSEHRTEKQKEEFAKVVENRKSKTPITVTKISSREKSPKRNYRRVQPKRKVKK
jgi:hypothetical protein